MTLATGLSIGVAIVSYYIAYLIGLNTGPNRKALESFFQEGYNAGVERVINQLEEEVAKRTTKEEE